MDTKAPPPAPSVTSGPRRWFVAGAYRAARLVVLGVLLAFFYSWGANRFYPAEGAAGFWYGTLHGALMPMALPALLASRDVPIYAERNTGRLYKLGYIAGINACGFIVFGCLFLKPRRSQDPQLQTPSTPCQGPPAP
ncbi:MAG: hypothetical protein HS113_24350 [Verrucomicrobiales bacterium]|nr:hypothetical protein [Verrucomicrobiales bacterium]